jgi:hypothetical protein
MDFCGRIQIVVEYRKKYGGRMIRVLSYVLIIAVVLGLLIPGISCTKTTPTPTPTPTATPSPSLSPTPIPTPTPVSSGSLRQLYGSEAIDYFFDIALGTEYGNTSLVLRKWTGDVRIKINGSPTRVDEDSLSAIVKELNDLISGVSAVRLQIVYTDPNVDIYFVPESQFPSIEPNYVPGNLGFCWNEWYLATNIIIKSTILIDTENTTQQQRQHLIREELTHSLGLANEPLKYPDSIFYQGWTTTTQYSSIDRKIIKLLYEPQLRAGMTREEIEAVLDTSVTSD